jgi:nitric oxide dioxygenase
MTTPRQIELVQDSFALVLPVTALAADEFYRRLFIIAPETKPLFRGDMADQGKKLFLTLAAVVDALDRLEDILPVATSLAVRHVAYGVKVAHYEAVGLALVETLAAMLGSAFDAETEAAWLCAYGILSAVMIDAAEKAAQPQINA